MGKIIGIDLGTSNSAAAVLEGGRPVTVPSAEGASQYGKAFPSYVAFTKEGGKLVGEPARRQAVANTEGTFTAFKRKMGTDFRYKAHGKEYRPQELSAFLLQKIRQDAEMYLGDKVEKAVITVPAYFDDNQRQATKDAGAIAGLEVVRIINEPTAAALAYGLDKADKDQKIVVFDLGGGTLDVTVMDFGKGVFEVKSTSGDTQLGGTDMDNAIVDYLVGVFLRETGLNVQEDRQAMQRLRDVKHDPLQSGGMGTPPHLRVEAGAIHRANGGVLFIDEVASLKARSQQGLLTAMQEKKYTITGQSENSSGAIVKTEPAPCEFVLVAAGNAVDMRMMHPALRSRIRGNGYEVYVQDSMPDTPENEERYVQFVAQEIKKDKKIPPFSYAAVAEIIDEARRKAGRKKRLSLNFRELGGLVRAAGDIANEEKAKIVDESHVTRARGIAQTIEQQMSRRFVESRKDYQVFASEGRMIGKVNGLAVLGDSTSGLVMPIVAEVTPASSKSEGKLIATGKLGTIAKEAVENVSAIIKKHIGKDVSQYDMHVQFLQTYEGVEGDSASISIAVAIISAMEGIPVRQDLAMTGSLSVRGEVLPVGGVTGKTEAAIEAGMKEVMVPKSNAEDIYLTGKLRGRIRIIPVGNFVDVLKVALVDSGKKRKLISKMSALLKVNERKQRRN